ncbi:hypothetical protein ROZALSC1DRAFT_21776 [Rozella allomycis CSF55]|uniref:Uncharacterized protein n=1 Tax=Rozella allomycis (strain CSF55) TaxID=988480 RepID=A0A4P9YLF5_ROZAC|nr:hypothetical protein ROZALSC1DRAFT_21776 [Rozella allomycis CSF55]
MIEAKRKYEENKKELDALQKDREQLRMNFQRITLFGGSLSSDLQKLKNDIEKMGFRNINIASSMTQEEVLTIERKSKTDNEKLVKTVQDYFFLEKERAQIMKNTTTLQNQADELVQKYNEAKKACLDQINWIRSVDINNREIPPPNGDLRVSSAFLGGISVSWSNALRVAKPLFAEAVQYFRNKLTEDSKINNDKIVKPTLQSDNATFENYSKYAEKLTTFNNMVKQRTQEIQSATDKNRGRAFKLWEYPEIQKIINFFMESGIRTYSPKRKNVEERLSNTSICFCPN